MSFATDVKNEISDLRLSKSENIAELSAFIRNNGHFSNNSILLYTENMMIAKRIYAIVKNVVIPPIASVLKLVFFSWKLK